MPLLDPLPSSENIPSRRVVRWNPIGNVELCPAQDPILVLRDRVGSVFECVKSIVTARAITPMLGKAVLILTVPALRTHPNSDVEQPRVALVLTRTRPDLEGLLEAFNRGRLMFVRIRVLRSVPRSPVPLLHESVRRPGVRH